MVDSGMVYLVMMKNAPDMKKRTPFAFLEGAQACLLAWERLGAGGVRRVDVGCWANTTFESTLLG